MGGRFGSTGLHKQSPRPLADFLRLRALEQAASPQELETVIKCAMATWDTLLTAPAQHR